MKVSKKEKLKYNPDVERYLITLDVVSKILISNKQCFLDTILLDTGELDWSHLQVRAELSSEHLGWLNIVISSLDLDCGWSVVDDLGFVWLHWFRVGEVFPGVDW